MTLPSSNLAFSALRSEYKLTSSGPISFNELYYGGPYLKKNACTDAVRSNGLATGSGGGYVPHFKDIPASGPIKASYYLGKAYYYAKQSNVFVNGFDAVFNTSSIEAESPKPNSPAYYVLITNGNCTSTSTSRYGLTINRGNAGKSTVYFINNNFIYGKGGAGGRGEDGGTNGENGGPALFVGPNCFIVNNNSILGGGGGGGGASSVKYTYNECYCCGPTNTSLAGSGGGGGAGGGAGGPPGIPPTSNFPNGANFGQNGNYNNTGAGGAGGSACANNVVVGTFCTPQAGNGGDWGSSGGNSATSGGSGGAGIVKQSGVDTDGGFLYKIITTGRIAGSY